MSNIDEDLKGFVHEHVFDVENNICGRDKNKAVAARLSHRSNEIKFKVENYHSPEVMFYAMDSAKQLIHKMYEIGKTHRSHEILHILGGKRK